MLLKPPERFFNRNEFHSLAGNDKPLAVVRVKEKKTLGKLHYHDFFELAMVTAGHGFYKDEEREYQLSSGDVFLLRPGMPHHYVRQTHLAVTNIIWLEDELQLPLYDLSATSGYHAFFELEPIIRTRSRVRHYLHLNTEQLAQVETLTRHLEKELKGYDSGAMLMAAGLFSQLLVFICRCYAGTTSGRQAELLQLDRVVVYIRQHYMHQISGKQLAYVAAMSESTLYRHFVATFGKSPTAFLIEQRLRHAEELLRQSDMKLMEIATACGFYDGNYFCTVFKRFYGITPRHYRLNSRQNK